MDSLIYGLILAIVAAVVAYLIGYSKRKGWDDAIGEKIETYICVSHLSASESDGNLYLIAGRQEFLRGVHLGFQIVGVDVQRHPHFLDINRLLILSCFLFTFCLFIAVFTVVHNPANVGSGLRRNVYKVKTLFGCNLKSLSGGHNAKLASVSINDADFLFTDFLIDIQVFFANGKAPPIPVVSNKFWTTKKHGRNPKRPHLNHSLSTKEDRLSQDIDPSNTKAKGENRAFCFIVA